ncbi:MAG: SAM-dependent methyltransferase, partial [Clostridia bacterium]|nr:SAM-dependent methyltransferase [Clostridia bacterium]
MNWSFFENIQEKKRLDVVKSLVPKGTRLLDIGTDHASLPIDLIKSGIITSAIASDVNKKPLERAESKIYKNGLSNRIVTILSNGFENIPENTFDCVAICGMGGHLISEIIEKGKSKAKNCDLILQPMSYPEALRYYLSTNGFEIINEAFAYDNGKPYVIIQARYASINTNFSYGELLFGKFRPNNQYYKLYENKILI